MTSKKRVYGTNKDKLEASRALRYEWRMLNESAVRIPIYENKDVIICNALIESFCVHLRNFIEFFHRDKRSPFWTDFLPRDKTISLKYKLNKYESKVNDLLSHCTYRRMNYKGTKKEWNISQIANEVNENMFQFIESADKRLLCNEIKEYLNFFKSENKPQDSSYVSTTSDAVSSKTLVCARRKL